MVYGEMKRRLTAKPMEVTTVRLLRADRELWFAASRLRGISQSEFLRVALREQATRTLASTAGQENRS